MVVNMEVEVEWLWGCKACLAMPLCEPVRVQRVWPKRVPVSAANYMAFAELDPCKIVAANVHQIAEVTHPNHITCVAAPFRLASFQGPSADMCCLTGLGPIPSGTTTAAGGITL